LKDHPETVNSRPHETWIVRLRLSDSNATGSLLDSAAYEQLISAS
jgi:glycine cleavage system H lipoate-binding protein